MSNRMMNFKPRFLGCVVRMSSNQGPLADDTWTPETYQEEVWDCGRNGMFGVNTTRMTMVQTGYFLIVEHSHMLVSSGIHYQRIMKNGTDIQNQQMRGDDIGSNGQSACIAQLAQLTLGDYIENNAYQDSVAGDDFVQAAADLYGDTRFAVVPLGI